MTVVKTETDKETADPTAGAESGKGKEEPSTTEESSPVKEEPDKKDVKKEKDKKTGKKEPVVEGPQQPVVEGPQQPKSESKRDAEAEEKEVKDSKDKDKDSKDKKKKKKRSRRSRSRSRKKRRRSRSRSKKKRRRERSRSRKRSRSRHKKKKRKRHRSKSKTKRSRSKSKSSPAKSPKKEEKKEKEPLATLATGKSKTTSPTPAQQSAINQQIYRARMADAKKGIGMLPEITRPARRLYVGNLPTGMGMNEMVLTQFFTECCRGLGITTKSPVISSWLNTDQTFGFVELRSVADTSLALQLFQGLQLGGRQLKFGRPVDYKVPPANLQNYVIPIPGEDNDKNSVSVQEGTPAAMLAKLQRSHVNMDSAVEAGVLAKDAPLGKVGTGDNAAKALVSSKSGPDEKNKSSVICLEGLMKREYFLDETEFDDVVDDIRVECYNLSLGTLEEVLVPKPGGETGEKGIMRVFLAFETVAGATRVLHKVHGRKYDEAEVDAWYFPIKHWENRRLDANKDGTLPEAERLAIMASEESRKKREESRKKRERGSPSSSPERKKKKKKNSKTVTQEELEAELLG